MGTVKLTLHLPKEDVEFAKRYAQEHRVTLTELISRYLRYLLSVSSSPIHPEVEKITGLVPASLDAKDLYRDHLRNKH